MANLEVREDTQKVTGFRCKGGCDKIFYTNVTPKFCPCCGAEFKFVVGMKFEVKTSKKTCGAGS